MQMLPLASQTEYYQKITSGYSHLLQLTDGEGRVGRNLAVRVQEGAAPEPPDLIEAAREAEALGLL